MVVKLHPGPRASRDQVGPLLIDDLRHLCHLNSGAIQQPHAASHVSPVQTVDLEVADPAGGKTLPTAALEAGTVQAGGAGAQLAGQDVV